MQKEVIDFSARNRQLVNAFEANYLLDTRLPQPVIQKHNHYEIYFLESGDVSYEVGSKKYKLQPGDILLIPPQETHRVVFDSWEASYSRLVIWLSEKYMQYMKELCNCNFALPFDLAKEKNYHLLRLHPEEREELFQIVYNMTIRKEDSYTRARNSISLTGLLIKLNQYYSRYALSGVNDNAFQKHLISVVDYIVNNFEKPLTLDDIADRCYISKSHLSHEFKKAMGVSVYQYLTKHRLFRAYQMLLSGIAPQIVAQRCGFHNYSDFYRAFRKQYQCSPKSIIP